MPTEDIIMGALVAAQNYIRQFTNQSTYGYFCGGDPRDFSPDAEVCTPEEIANHKAACEAWEKGDRTPPDAHRHDLVSTDGTTTVMVSRPGAFGMGVYSSSDAEADDVLDQLDQAMAALGSGESEGTGQVKP